MNPSTFVRFDPEPVYRQRGWLIGEGRCGGKAKGLAFALSSLEGSALGEQIRLPDFTYVLTTEVFGDFLVSSGLEDLYDEEDWESVRPRIDGAPLSPALREDLERILEEAGDVPLAIRSSSLLEDSLSLSFAGKYETCFSPNTGSREERLASLERCVKTVWASLFNPSARAYRAKHGREDRKESMAVLVQQVVGRPREGYYYPELAGALFSRVFRRPTPRVRKEDGVMRLCFGLGTRTVDRGNARVFYLTNPALRPEGNRPSQIAESSQVDFDYIDQTYGAFLTGSLSHLFLPFILRNHRNAGAFIEHYGDEALHSTLADPGIPTRPLFTFPGLPQRSRHLFDLSSRLMAHLETTMGTPVDLEFTYETEGEEFHLVQMRPLASFEEMARVRIPDLPEERVLLRGDRMVSNGRMEGLSHLVYVDPEAYVNRWDPVGAAQAVGEFNRRLRGTPYVLVGPGRWGSRNPALGVPVQYAQICHCGCLAELSLPQYGFTPELSYGTHFFLDMDNDGILYLPVFAGQPRNAFRGDWFETTPYETGSHPAVRLYRGTFDIFLDGESETGVVAAR